MSDITKATAFMLLSTFSLFLSGLMAKYLSVSMPVSFLSFVRFLLPSLFLFLFLMFYKITKPSLDMWKPLVMRANVAVDFRITLLKFILIQIRRQ